MEVDDRDREMTGSLRVGGRVGGGVGDARGYARWTSGWGRASFDDGQESWAEDMHPSSEDDEVRSGFYDSASYFPIIVFPRGPGNLVEESLERADLGWDGGRVGGSSVETFDGGAGGNDVCDLSVGESKSSSSVHESLKVGAYEKQSGV